MTKSPLLTPEALRSRIAGLAGVALSNALISLTGADFQVVSPKAGKPKRQKPR